MGERRELVFQLPQGLAALGSRQHIGFATFGYRIFQEVEDGQHLRGGLHVEVVHADCGGNALRIVADSLPEFVEGEEDAHTIIVNVGGGLQCRSIAVGHLQVAVVFLLPLFHLGELTGHSILHQSGVTLCLGLRLHGLVDDAVAGGQDGVFSRVGSHNLRMGMVVAQQQQDKCYHRHHQPFALRFVFTRGKQSGGDPAEEVIWYS